MEPNVLFSSTGEAIVWIFACVIILSIGIQFFKSGINYKLKSKEWREKTNKGIDIWLGAGSILGSILGFISVLGDWHLRSRNYALSYEVATLAMVFGILGIIVAWVLFSKDIKKRKLGPLSNAANRKEKLFIYARIVWGAGLIIASPVIFMMGLISWSPWK